MQFQQMTVQSKIGMKVTISPSAELCSDTSIPAWYCVRTHLKHEHIAAAHLRRFAGVEVFNPQLRLLRMTRSGQKWFTESLFPNYVFARFALESMLEKVTYTPAVKLVLRFGDRVPEIAEAVIEDLRREIRELDSQVLTDAPFEGDEIAIATGPFAGTTALVTRVFPGKQRAQILVEVMGRSVTADLTLDCVIRTRRDVAEIAFHRSKPVAGKQLKCCSSAQL